ncbi:hypothetical protein MVES_003787 [Malassezia vespertilionis]|uniref:SAP domain-containing protein n=1 Tax=Malassezia vespertilionis TaxID=2020962 RepID=A0A2N1J6X3_9BASI|nr:hypothetical protein MVES_003787 [Malassezia vespertilionis]
MEAKLQSLRVPELKELLQAASLPTTGNKPDLLKRLLENSAATESLESDLAAKTAPAPESKSQDAASAPQTEPASETIAPAAASATAPAAETGEDTRKQAYLAELEKRKTRALRFGQPIDELEKQIEHVAKHGVPEKGKATVERAHSQLHGKRERPAQTKETSNKKAAPVAPAPKISEEELAQRQRRAERFGLVNADEEKRKQERMQRFQQTSEVCASKRTEYAKPTLGPPKSLLLPDVARYVPMQDYDYNQMMQDYSYLNQVGRVVASRGRELADARMLPDEERRGKKRSSAAQHRREQLSKQISFHKLPIMLLPDDTIFRAELAAYTERDAKQQKTGTSTDNCANKSIPDALSRDCVLLLRIYPSRLRNESTTRFLDWWSRKGAALEQHSVLDSAPPKASEPLVPQHVLDTVSKFRTGRIAPTTENVQLYSTYVYVEPDLSIDALLRRLPTGHAIVEYLELEVWPKDVYAANQRRGQIQVMSLQVPEMGPDLGPTTETSTPLSTQATIPTDATVLVGYASSDSE